MTTETIPQKGNLSFLAKTGQWLRALDEAVHYDPVEKLHHRIDQLERRFAEIECNFQSGNGDGK